MQCALAMLTTTTFLYQFSIEYHIAIIIVPLYTFLRILCEL